MKTHTELTSFLESIGIPYEYIDSLGVAIGDDGTGASMYVLDDALLDKCRVCTKVYILPETKKVIRWDSEIQGANHDVYMIHVKLIH